MNIAYASIIAVIVVMATSSYSDLLITGSMIFSSQSGHQRDGLHEFVTLVIPSLVMNNNFQSILRLEVLLMLAICLLVNTYLVTLTTGK